MILCKIARHSQLYSSDLYLIYIWTELLPKYPGYVNYVRISSYLYLYTHKLPTAEAYKTMFIWSISYRFLEHLKFPNLLPLTIGAGVGLLACILYFFRIFSKYAFAIVLIPHFLLSRWILMRSQFWFLEPMTLHQDHSHWNLRTKFLLLQWQINITTKE